MKKILALAVLAGALSGCIITVEGSTGPSSVASASFIASYYDNGAPSQYLICGNKDNYVRVNFNWSGSLAGYRVEFYGKNNPDVVVGFPSTTGFFALPRADVNESTKVGSETILYAGSEIHPTNGTVRPQAVIVTPAPVTNPSTNPLGATRIRILAKGTDGSVTTFNLAGELGILTNANSQCQ